MDCELDIYASVVLHDYYERRHFVDHLKKLDVTAVVNGGDRVSFRHHGHRNKVMELAELCYTCTFHSIHVSH